MKLFLLLVAITAAKCITFEKVEGIDGRVFSLDFDIYSNTYLLVERNYVFTLYKLDASNNIILAKELPSNNRTEGYAILNKLGDVYVFVSDFDNLTQTVWYLEANTESVELLAQYTYGYHGCVDLLNFIDDDDIVYVSHKQGVSYLRPRKNVLLGVDGLQEVSICSHAVDGKGDLYLNLGNRQPMVITKEAKNLPIILAKNIIVPKEGIDYVINGYNNHVFGVNGVKTRGPVTTLQILKENSTKLVFLAYDISVNIPYFTKEHFVFFPDGNYDTYSSSELYILSSDEIIQTMKNDFFSRSSVDGNILPATNSEGHIFYSWRNYTGPGDYDYAGYGVLIIKPQERKAEVVTVPSDSIVYSILVDVDDNVWIISKGLYMLPKGANEVTQISDLPLEVVGEYTIHMKQKTWTKDIYIRTTKGLYVVKEY